MIFSQITMRTSLGLLLCSQGNEYMIDIIIFSFVKHHHLNRSKARLNIENYYTY